MSSDSSKKDTADNEGATQHEDSSRNLSFTTGDLDQFLEPSDTGQSKLELDTSRLAQADKGADEVAVIIKVAEPEYVPPGIEVRAQIDSHIFTARVRREDLDRIQQDPRVVSVSTAKRLRLPRS